MNDGCVDMSENRTCVCVYMMMHTKEPLRFHFVYLCHVMVSEIIISL